MSKRNVIFTEETKNIREKGKMELTDTHSHLYEDEFKEDRDEVIQRLKEKHVTQVYLPNIDNESIDKMLQLYRSDKQLFHIMMGLHPTSVKEDYKEMVDLIWGRLSEEEICAIGEIGIDLYWDKTYLKEQTEAFEIQVDWAVRQGYPIVIHTRKAFEETFHSLKKFDKNKLRGIFHCYSGSKEIAEEIFKIGDFSIGVGGVLTFKNAGLAQVVKEIPLEKIVLETDCPYLTPAPYRGQRNESSCVYYVAEKLAEIKGVSLEEIAEATTRNARNIFGRKPFL